ncbi:unnamed protein product [Meloidogyne enterolobii]|uniref:Uncharacterized protein n=1 Tax=Meloidogyne enterolobii TaxID=390850 RepID=A0ACB1AUU4_MELEN
MPPLKEKPLFGIRPLKVWLTTGRRGKLLKTIPSILRIPHYKIPPILDTFNIRYSHYKMLPL